MDAGMNEKWKEGKGQRKRKRKGKEKDEGCMNYTRRVSKYIQAGVCRYFSASTKCVQR